MSKSNLPFLIFFAVYTAVAIFLLLLGLGSGETAAGLRLFDALTAIAPSDGNLYDLQRGMAVATQLSESAGQIALDYFLSVLNLGLGVFIVWRRPGDWVARLLGLGMVGTAMAFNYQAHGIALVMLGVVNSLHFALHAISGAMYVHALLIFPNGKLVPRWSGRFLVVVYLLMGVTIVGTFLFLGAGPIEYKVNLDQFRQLVLAETVFFVLLFGLFIPIVGVTSQTYRYRTASSAQERQQIRLVRGALTLAFGVGLLLSLIVLGLSAAQSVGFTSENLIQLEVLVFRIASPPFAVIPIALLIAILRYGLFDIQVIINRALVYGTLTGALALVFFGSVALFQQLFQSLTGREQSDFATVISTLLSAALFTPLRRWVQEAIDRRLYRRKYDAQRILAAFSGAVRDEVDSDKIGEALLNVVEDTVRPEHVSLWLR